MRDLDSILASEYDREAREMTRTHRALFDASTISLARFRCLAIAVLSILGLAVLAVEILAGEVIR